MRFTYGDVITLPDSTLRIMVIKPLVNDSSDAEGVVLVAEKRSLYSLGTIWGRAGDHTFLNTEHKDWRKVE